MLIIRYAQIVQMFLWARLVWQKVFRSLSLAAMACSVTICLRMTRLLSFRVWPLDTSYIYIVIVPLSFLKWSLLNVILASSHVGQCKSVSRELHLHLIEIALLFGFMNTLLRCRTIGSML